MGDAAPAGGGRSFASASVGADTYGRSRGYGGRHSLRVHAVSWDATVYSAWAEMRIDSGLAALLSSTLPIWMVLLAPLYGQESELNRRVLSGIALGFAGVAVSVPMDFTGHQPEGLGRWRWWRPRCYGRWARFIRAGEIEYARGHLRGHADGLWGRAAVDRGPGTGEGGPLHPEAFTVRSLLSLAFLIVFGSLVAFTAYVWLLQVSSPAIVSTHSYVNPVVAVALGWAFAGESVTWRTAFRTAVILASVALLSVRKAGPADTSAGLIRPI